jgi:hypothetical protein
MIFCENISWKYCDRFPASYNCTIIHAHKCYIEMEIYCPLGEQEVCWALQNDAFHK